MKLELGMPFNDVEWDEALDTLNTAPISYEGFTRRTSDLVLIKEIVGLFSEGGFDSIGRSES